MKYRKGEFFIFSMFFNKCVFFGLVLCVNYEFSYKLNIDIEIKCEEIFIII